MLTNRFDPVDVDSLNKKAEDLTCERDVLVGLDDAPVDTGEADNVDTATQEGRCHAKGDDKAGTAKGWTSRLARVLPKVRGHDQS